MRARFDEHKDELDLVKATKILEDAEKKFNEMKHPQQMICTLHLRNVFHQVNCCLL